MDGISGDRAYPEHRLVLVCPRPEVGNCAEKFVGVTLFLKRIIGGGGPRDLDFRSLQLKCLLCSGSELEYSLNCDGSADILLCDLFIVAELFSLKHHLKAGKRASVIQVDEAEIVVCPDCAAPAGNGDFFTGTAFR